MTLPWLSLLLSLSCGDDDTRRSTDGSAEPIGTGEPGTSDGASSGMCPTATGADEPSDFAGLCPQESAFGRFVIERQSGFSFVDGKVADSVVPNTVRTEELTSGACRLLRRRLPFCDPGCAGDETCTFEGTCIPYPQPQSLGDVCVQGLAEPVQLSPTGASLVYSAVDLEHPAFSGGEPIVLSAILSDASEPLVLRGTGVTLLESAQTAWAITEGENLDVTWLPRESDPNVRVVVRVSVDQHGTSPLDLSCEFPDTGSGVIEADVLDALLQSGVSGYPKGSLTRRTADSAAWGDGCIDLEVRTPLEVDIQVTGHTPCRRDTDCTVEGQTCTVAIETCE